MHGFWVHPRCGVCSCVLEVPTGAAAAAGCTGSWAASVLSAALAALLLAYCCLHLLWLYVRACASSVLPFTLGAYAHAECFHSTIALPLLQVIDTERPRHMFGCAKCIPAFCCTGLDLTLVWMYTHSDLPCHCQHHIYVSGCSVYMSVGVLGPQLQSSKVWQHAPDRAAQPKGC